VLDLFPHAAIPSYLTLPVPVHERLLAAVICEIDTELLTSLEPNAWAFTRSNEAVHSRCAAIYL
jgi:hypothetical protein